MSDTADVSLELVVTYEYGGWRVGIRRQDGRVETIETRFSADYYGRRQTEGHATPDDAVASLVRLLNRLAVKEDM